MPVRNYRQKTGRQVKGVTTILSIMSKPALMFWAFKQGMSNFDRLMRIISQLSCDQEPQLQDIIKTFQTTGLYDKRDRAADAGTLAHSFVENYLRGLSDPKTDGLPADVIKKAEGCYLTFLDWEKSNKIKVIGSEIPITSEKYPFGGTIDHIIQSAMTPNAVDILDIKTGKDIYLEAKIQVRAYKEIWEENDERKVAGFHILRLGENGEFVHHYFPSLDEKYFTIFLNCLNISECLLQLGEKL